MQKHKLYGSLSLLVPTHKWKYFSIDFVIGLPKSKNWQKIQYYSIFLIVERLTKMVHYKLVLTMLDAEQLAKILIKTVIKYYSLLDSIITD